MTGDNIPPLSECDGTHSHMSVLTAHLIYDNARSRDNIPPLSEECDGTHSHLAALKADLIYDTAESRRDFDRQNWEAMKHDFDRIVEEGDRAWAEYDAAVAEAESGREEAPWDLTDEKIKMADLKRTMTIGKSMMGVASRYPKSK